MPKHYSAAQKLSRKTSALERTHSHLVNVDQKGAKEMAARIVRHRRARAKLLQKSRVGKVNPY